MLLRARGLPVVGTDPHPDDEVRARLEAAGVTVHRVQDGSRIRGDTQLVVASAALSRDHPELEVARQQGIEVVRYAALLGAIVNHSEGVAVAGTHGKTTTTAILVWAFQRAGLDPGFIVGGYVPQLEASAGSGGSRVFVAEACEYDRSFLNLAPHRAIITTVNTDHLDIYGDLAGVQESFAEFAARIRPEGVLVHPADDEAVAPVVGSARCKRLTFSTSGPADLVALDIRADGARTAFELLFDGERTGTVSLRLPGVHNVRNALAALAICVDLGLPLDSVVPGLESFAGVERRFEHRGDAGGVTVIDDYAHHPTEIRALLQGAAMRYPDRRLVVVFQPHQLSRTRLLMGEFASAFGRADLLIVTNVYAARDAGAKAAGLSSATLVERIAQTGTRVERTSDIPATTELLSQRLEPGDVVLTVGAGDVHLVAGEILARLEARS